MASAVRAVLADGAIVNMFRGAMAANGVTRFFQEFYFPSALLYLCFSSSPQKKKIVSLFYLVVSFSMVLVADRSGGITALVVFAFYHFYTSKNKKQDSVLGGIRNFFSGSLICCRYGQNQRQRYRERTGRKNIVECY